MASKSSDPTLTIRIGDHVVTWRRSDLMKSKHLATIKVPSDPAYGRTVKKFEAVPAATLFAKAAGRKQLAEMIKNGAVLEFICLDGFSAKLPIQLVMNSSPNKAIAYIAIEPPDRQWPNLPGVHPRFKTAGPFYLIWKNAEKSGIGQEQWPFQLVSFAVKPPIAKLFPKIIPNTKNENVLAGYKLFVKNCFTCHTMGGEGDSQLGPDLNVPMNPTEYLREGMIRRLIRNPQNLRQWPEAKMSSFGPDVLSDKDIDRIIDYLKFMAQHRRSSSRSLSK